MSLIIEISKDFANYPSLNSRRVANIRWCRSVATELSLLPPLFLELEVSRFEKYLTRQILQLGRRAQEALPFGFFVTQKGRDPVGMPPFGPEQP